MYLGMDARCSSVSAWPLPHSLWDPGDLVAFPLYNRATYTVRRHRRVQCISTNPQSILTISRALHTTTNHGRPYNRCDKKYFTQAQILTRSHAHITRVSDRIRKAAAHNMPKRREQNRV